MSFFIKYPPSGDEDSRRPTVTGTGDGAMFRGANWEPCTNGIEPEYGIAPHAIRNCKNNFDETGNPLYAFEALRLATAVKLYPPLWVLEFLNTRIAHAVTKRQSLDKAFGFTRAGLGKGRRTDPFEGDHLRERNRLLCMMVFKLEGAGLTRPQACKALSSLLARIPDGGKLSIDGNSRHALSRLQLTGKGMEKAIKESEGDWIDEKVMTTEAAKAWTADDKRKLLSVFYSPELPVHIVRQLKQN